MRTSIPVPRYVVTELEGYDTAARSAKRPGLSCHIIDTAVNHRLIASYRTESYRAGLFGNGDLIRRAVREKAAGHAARLNAALDS